MNRTEDEQLHLNNVIVSAARYVTFKSWLYGNPNIRAYQMHIEKRDMELSGALYRASRNQRYQKQSEGGLK